MTWQKLELLKIVRDEGEHGLIETDPRLTQPFRPRIRTARSLHKSGHLRKSMVGIYFLSDEGRKALEDDDQ